MTLKKLDEKVNKQADFKSTHNIKPVVLMCVYGGGGAVLLRDREKTATALKPQLLFNSEPHEIHQQQSSLLVILVS